MLTSSSSFLKEHNTVVQWCIKVIDIIVLIITGLLSYRYYFGHTDLPNIYRNAIAYSGLLALIIYPYCGIYQSWRNSSFIKEIKTLFIAYSTLFTALVIIAFSLKISADYSRMWTGYWYLTGLIIWCGTRLTARHILHILRRKGFNTRSVLVIGSGDHTNQVVKHINDAAWTGLRVIGVVRSSSQTSEIINYPIVCHLNDLRDYLTKNPVDQIWIALSVTESEKVKHILKSLETSTADIKMVPDLLGLKLLNHSITEINHMPVLNISVSPMEGINYVIKNIEDKVLSLLFLLLLSPIMGIIAISIKMTSPGPILYRQERMGWNGTPFKMLKFRSMPVDSEKGKILWGNAKSKDITPIGKFLRITSLDEIPQFINVLKGDMSIVGPRPERTIFVDKFKEEIRHYMKKHMVKAGITGWAQINGWRGDTDLEKRIECDIYYIDHWSLWLDIKIIFSTIINGLFNKNNYI